MPIAIAVHASRFIIFFYFFLFYYLNKNIYLYIYSSIPFLFEPVLWKNKLYVDGGCIRNLPHDAFKINLDLFDKNTMLALSLRDDGRRGVPIKYNISTFQEFATQFMRTLIFGPDSSNSLLNLDHETLNKLDIHELGLFKFILLILYNHFIISKLI